MTATDDNGARPSAALMAKWQMRCALAQRPVAAGLSLSLSLWCGMAWAVLPPIPQAELDAHVTIEGTVVAITHGDKDLEPEPRNLFGRRRMIRTFVLTVRIEKAIAGRDPVAGPPPSGDTVLIHGTELIGPATEGGVDHISELRKGSTGRFHLELHDDGAWFIMAPNGLEPLGDP